MHRPKLRFLLAAATGLPLAALVSAGAAPAQTGQPVQLQEKVQQQVQEKGKDAAKDAAEQKLREGAGAPAVPGGNAPVSATPIPLPHPVPPTAAGKDALPAQGEMPKLPGK